MERKRKNRRKLSKDARALIYLFLMSVIVLAAAFVVFSMMGYCPLNLPTMAC